MRVLNLSNTTCERRELRSYWMLDIGHLNLQPAIRNVIIDIRNLYNGYSDARIVTDLISHVFTTATISRKLIPFCSTRYGSKLKKPRVRHGEAAPLPIIKPHTVLCWADSLTLRLCLCPCVSPFAKYFRTHKLNR